MKKNIAVIGAAGDVGQGVVDQLLQAGHRVIAVGRNAEKLENLSARLTARGQLDIVVGSVENEATAAALLAQIRELAPQLDGVVVSVNAPLEIKPLVDVDSTQLTQVLQANLVTHLVAAKTFVPALAPAGIYLGIGGGMADLIMPGFGMNSICQAAQRNMYRALAEELKDRGVRVQELMLYSMIAGASNRDKAHPKWITDDDVGRHVVAVIDNPAWFPEPIITLKSRKDAGLQPAAASAS